MSDGRGGSISFGPIHRFFFFCKLERERVSRRFFSNDWRKRIARLCLRSSFNTGTKANLAGE